MPTSPHWAPTNSPELFEKTGAFCRVDVGIDPYEPPGKFQKNRRDGRGFPPFGSYEFSVDFRKNRIFCGWTEASAPTNFFDTLCKNASARSAILLARRGFFALGGQSPEQEAGKNFRICLTDGARRAITIPTYQVGGINNRRPGCLWQSFFLLPPSTCDVAAGRKR